MVTAQQTVFIERHELSDGLAALTFSALGTETGDRANLPLAFVLHGLGSRKERHLDLCLRLAKAGFLACMVDARFHGDRRTAESSLALSGERTSPLFAAAFSETVRGTVADVMRLASYFGDRRYSLIGHSMGGFIAVHTALADRRVTAVGNVSGSINVRPPAGIVLTPEQAAVWQQADPSLRAASLYPCALLLLHGDNDESVPVEGARRLYEAALPGYRDNTARLCLEIVPGAGHEWNSNRADRAVEWLTRWKGDRIDGT